MIGQKNCDSCNHMTGGKWKSEGLGPIARREKSKVRWLAMQKNGNSSQVLEELAKNITQKKRVKRPDTTKVCFNN